MSAGGLRGSVTVAVGASGDITIENNSGLPFIIDRVIFRARLAATYVTAVAGTPLLRTPHPLTTQNTMPSLDLVRVNVRAGDRLWFNESVTLGALGGEETPWLSVRHTLAPKATIRIPVNSDVFAGGPSIVVEALLKGNFIEG